MIEAGKQPKELPQDRFSRWPFRCTHHFQSAGSIVQMEMTNNSITTLNTMIPYPCHTYIDSDLNTNKPDDDYNDLVLLDIRKTSLPRNSQPLLWVAKSE